jgi:glycosyltransferase involved in cell wall biosynthesis
MQHASRPALDIAIPVHNEERDLEASIRALHAHVQRQLPYSTRITIVDNASTDATQAIGARIAGHLDGVRFMRIDGMGRGRALRAAWLASDADVVAYMDVDLSTDLRALRDLVDPLLAGDADVAIGSRLIAGARVSRSLKRECISRCYNLLLHTFLHLRVRDAQCGCKAVRAGVARELLPSVRDEGWFFDTELLVLAQRARLRTLEIPVTWIEDTDSRVKIVSTAMKDLRGVARMLRSQPGTVGNSPQVAFSQDSPRNL